MNCSGCGRKAVVRTVKKEGSNNGRTFFSCPKKQSEKDADCSTFFEWETAHTTTSAVTTTAAATTTSAAKTSAADDSRKAVDRSKVHNLSDAKYCCVWNVEVFSQAPRSEEVRALLQKVADHVAPVLRYRGWRGE
jgi:hypothetical protein